MISIIIVLRTHVLDTHACFQFPSSTRKACIHIHGTPCALFDQWGKDWSSFFLKKKTSQVAWEYWRFPFRGGAYGEAAHFWTYWVLIPEQRWQCKGIKFNESTSGNHCQLIKFIKFKLSSTPKLPIKYSTSFPCFNHCRFATWRRACLVGYQNMGMPVFFY